MSDEDVERLLHAVLGKLDKLQQGQSNHARLLGEIKHLLGSVAPLDITGAGSSLPPPPIDPDLLAGATPADRERARANVQAIREKLTAV